MPIDAEKLAAFTAKELDNLENNVRRLVESGTAAQVLEAARVIPLIEAERANRPPTAKAKAAAKAKAPAKPKAAKKTAKKKAEEPAESEG